MIPLWLTALPLNLIRVEADAQDISWELLSSIVMVESRGDPYAMNFESHWPYEHGALEASNRLKISVDTERQLQKYGYGLCQVMGTVLREQGFKDHLTASLDAKTNLFYGAKVLKNLYKKYPNILDVISSYNQGSPTKINGGYKNQEYVDKVLFYLKEITTESFLLAGLRV